MRDLLRAEGRVPRCGRALRREDESPPYTLCPICGRNFFIHYDSEKKLALHRAAEGECKPQERELHERVNNLPPRPLTNCWGVPCPAKKPRKPRAPRAKGGAQGGH